MSGEPTMNIVDDDEMSSQGTANVPVAVPRIEALIPATIQQSFVLPFGLPLWLQSPITQIAPIVQSSVFVRPSGIAPTIPVARGMVQLNATTLTILVDVLIKAIFRYWRVRS